LLVGVKDPRSAEGRLTGMAEGEWQIGKAVGGM
jgi:hypothetical protein